MSAPFTIDSTNWQLKAEEFRLAISERNYARFGNHLRFAWTGTRYDWVTGDGTIADKLQNGKNLQSSAFWLGAQEKIEELAFWAADPVSNLSGSTLLRFGSFKNFCEFAGGVLYTSDSDYGWRRASALDEFGNPVVVRGEHQAGDLIGVWLIDSIRLALENMTAFALGVSNTGTGFKSSFSGSKIITFESGDTPEEVNAKYNAAINEAFNDGTGDDGNPIQDVRGPYCSFELVFSGELERTLRFPGNLIEWDAVQSYGNVVATNSDGVQANDRFLNVDLYDAAYPFEIWPVFSSSYNKILSNQGKDFVYTSTPGTSDRPVFPDDFRSISGSRDRYATSAKKYQGVYRFDFTNA